MNSALFFLQKALAAASSFGFASAAYLRLPLVLVELFLPEFKSSSPHQLKKTPVRGVSFNWRRGRDSNSGRARTLDGFQDRCIKPLCHLSMDL